MGRPVKYKTISQLISNIKIGANAVSNVGSIIKQEGFNRYYVTDGTNKGRVTLQLPLTYPNGNISGYNANSIVITATTAANTIIYVKKLTNTKVYGFDDNVYKWSFSAASNANINASTTGTNISTVLLPTFNNQPNVPNVTLGFVQPSSTNFRLGSEPIEINGTIVPQIGVDIQVALGKSANTAPAYAYFVHAHRDNADSSWYAQYPVPNIGGAYYGWAMTGANNNVNVSTFTYNFS